MMRLKLKYIYLITLCFIVSCSSAYYKKSETIAEKMKRYETRGLDNNIVPKIAIFEKVTFEKSGRSIASSKHLKKLNFSNKRLYFLSLLSQYESLRGYLPNNETAGINICPSFHTSVVDFKKSFSVNISNTKAVFSTRNYLSSLSRKNIQAVYPELSLPLSERQSFPTAFDLIYKKVDNKDEIEKIVSKAFQINMTKIHKELKELCESGFSSNYYVYENLLTHIQTNGNLGHNVNGIKILFKTSLFSNMALLNSLKSQRSQKSNSRFPASNHSHNNNHNFYEKEIIRRLGVIWTKDYFNKIGKLN